LSQFENLYKSEHAKRILLFLPTESYGDISVRFPSGTFIFSCSALQMAILICVIKQAAPIDILMSKLHLIPELFMPAIQPMLDIHLLVQHPEATGTLSLNLEFSSSEKRRIFLSDLSIDGRIQPSLRTSSFIKDPAGASPSSSSFIHPDERRFNIQAAIVRILKKERQLTVSALLTTLNSQHQLQIAISPELLDSLLQVLQEKGFISLKEDLASYNP
jgi:Cullin protein neddylation domain